MAAGVILLVLTRPYEGMLLCLPVAAVLGHWAFFGKNRLRPSLLLRQAAVPLALLVAALAWLGYYDYRAFGNPLTLPYTVNRATYAMAPYFVWQQARPEPAYRHEEMRRFYRENELEVYQKIHSPAGFLPQTLIKAARGVKFFAGLALLPPLFLLPLALRDRRMRLLVLCLVVFLGGMLIEIFMVPHYLAPFTAVVYALALQSMRHLWQWRPGGQNVGAALMRFCVILCLVMAGLRLFDQPLHLPANRNGSDWCGPDHFGVERAGIEQKLDGLPGKQLALVRYAPGHDVMDEWVYNSADIGASKVVWAREMDAASDLQLMRYYQDRKVWLVEPDRMPAAITPYPAPEQPAAR
jgi:hypothetical protein